MSVYTELSPAKISVLLAKYGLVYVDATPVTSGIENSNYFVRYLAVDNLQAIPQMAVLTLFEQLSAAAVAALAVLLGIVNHAQIPVAAPFNSTKVYSIAHKPVWLAAKLQGSHATTPTSAQCYAVGERLAQLHMALAAHGKNKQLAPLIERVGLDGPQQWRTDALQQINGYSTADIALLQTVFEYFDKAIQQSPNCPMGLIHGDLFRDNCLFEGDTLSGLLDFSETHINYWLFDIAICVNDFCSAWPDVALDASKVTKVLEGYQRVRQLTADEVHNMPVFLAMAACRFWLSRLVVNTRNKNLATAGKVVLVKNPLEMREMLEDRLIAC